MHHIISLGAGVQSSTMALMATHGEIEPMPELAIFADTGWEPEAVYDWLTFLESKTSFPIVRVSAGNIRYDQMHKRRTPGKMSERQKKESRFASMPYFTGNGGLVKRQCTQEYKIEPITKYIRQHVLKLRPRQWAPREAVVVQWLGISADEAQRMKPSRSKWRKNRYPLAMEHAMSRADCLQWMHRNGYPKPPRSACIGCPFHSDSEWKEIKKNAAEWYQALQFDKAIRYSAGLKHKTFLHRSLKPLNQVDFNESQDELFGNECDGYCGV